MSGPAPRPPPTREALDRYAAAFSASRTLKAFGVRISFPDAHTVEAVLDPVREDQRGGLGSDAVNGGVLAAIFDLAIGCAPATIDPTRRTATMQLSMNFMRPLRGSRLVARGRVDRAGNAVLFCSAEVLDGQGEVCATCTGLVRMSEARWASGESPAVN